MCNECIAHATMNQWKINLRFMTGINDYRNNGQSLSISVRCERTSSTFHFIAALLRRIFIFLPLRLLFVCHLIRYWLMGEIIILLVWFAGDVRAHSGCDCTRVTRQNANSPHRQKEFTFVRIFGFPFYWLRHFFHLPRASCVSGAALRFHFHSG